MAATQPAPHDLQENDMSRFTRRITAAAAGPLVAAGILAGTLAVAAPAEASPQADTKCSSMAMPNDSTGASPSQLNLLTRAAQVNAANQTPQAPNMDMTC
ncbi:MAG: hypothetical protein H6522_03800 [Mycolicibacterium sp.]|nr:hypothetical protein [Mycolicibacterium sp.]